MKNRICNCYLCKFSRAFNKAIVKVKDKKVRKEIDDAVGAFYEHSGNENTDISMENIRLGEQAEKLCMEIFEANQELDKLRKIK